MRQRNTKDITMTLTVGRDMTPSEEEQFLDLLFSWFIRDYENDQDVMRKIDSNITKAK